MDGDREIGYIHSDSAGHIHAGNC